MRHESPFELSFLRRCNIRRKKRVIFRPRTALANVVLCMMAEERQSQWKNSRDFPCDEIFADFQCDEGWLPSLAYFGMKSWENCGWRAVDSGSAMLLQFPCCLWFRFSNGARPKSGHAPKAGMKWLQTVYIIPTTFSSNGEIVKSCARRGGVDWHRKRSHWPTSSLIRKFISISSRQKLVFSPLFGVLRLWNLLGVPLVCLLWK